MRIDPKPSLNLQDYAFSHPIRVRFAETDAMGIVHHSRYLPYLEQTRVEYLRAIGHPYTSRLNDGIDYAVIEAHVNYRAPLRFDDIVMVHLRLSAATRATFTMSYVLEIDGSLRATASTVHGCVNAKGSPVRMPLWLQELTASLL